MPLVTSSDEKALQKLDEFLTQLKEQLQRYTQPAQNISHLLSDCDDVLKSILDYFRHYEDTIKFHDNTQLLADITDKALDVVEFVIHVPSDLPSANHFNSAQDPKYKKQIEQSPQFLGDLLNLIAKVESSYNIPIDTQTDHNSPCLGNRK